MSELLPDELEQQLRGFYRREHGPPLTAETLWPRVAAALPTEREISMSTPKIHPTPNSSSTAPASGRQPRRILSSISAVAAVIVVITLGVAIFAVFAHHGPGSGVATHPQPTATHAAPTAVPANIPIDPKTGLPTSGEIADLAMNGSNDGWAVGNYIPTNSNDSTAYILHFDGTRWQLSGPSIKRAYLGSLSIAAPGDIWAVGSSEQGTNQRDGDALLLHYFNGAWHMGTLPGMGLPENIRMFSATTGWASGLSAGQHPTPLLLRYQHGEWTPVALPAGLTDVGGQSFSMVSMDEGWMSGDEGLWHYQHGGWHLVVAAPYIGAFTLSTISMNGATDGWAGGSSPDQSSIPLATTNGKPDMAPASDGGGVFPILLHYDGTAWHRATVPPSIVADKIPVSLIAMTSATDGWMDAQDGLGTQVMLHYNGQAWSPTPLPANTELIAAISGVNPTDAWACGRNMNANGTYTPVLLHYAGDAWQVYTQP